MGKLRKEITLDISIHDTGYIVYIYSEPVLFSHKCNKNTVLISVKPITVTIHSLQR
jgi:hypothetical protein